MSETFKTEQKKEVKETTAKKRILQLWDEDQTEIKRLDTEDVQDIVAIMRKCAFDVTDKEILTILAYSMSYGCYVNRMLIGVGLSWPAHYDESIKGLRNGEQNATYVEDPAVLLAYEGRGIRRMLLKAREEDAKSRGFKYIIAYLSQDLPKGGIEDYILESGSQLEKLYLSEKYQFLKTDRGILAFKTLS